MRKTGILAFGLALVAVAGFAQEPTNAPVTLAEIFSPATPDNPGAELPGEDLFAPEPLQRSGWLSGCTTEGEYRWFHTGCCAYNIKGKDQFRCTNGQWVETGESACFYAPCA